MANQSKIDNISATVLSVKSGPKRRLKRNSVYFSRFRDFFINCSVLKVCCLSFSVLTVSCRTSWPLAERTSSADIFIKNKSKRENRSHIIFVCKFAMLLEQF